MTAKTDERLRQNETARTAQVTLEFPRIIIEQALEWKNKLYKNFVYFEKQREDEDNFGKIWNVTEIY